MNRKFPSSREQFTRHHIGPYWRCYQIVSSDPSKFLRDLSFSVIVHQFARLIVFLFWAPKMLFYPDCLDRICIVIASLLSLELRVSSTGTDRRQVMTNWSSQHCRRRTCASENSFFIRGKVIVLKMRQGSK